MQVTFFGSDIRVLEAVLDHVEVSSVIAEKTKVTNSLVDLCYLRGFDFHVVGSRAELPLHLLGDSALGVACGFGVIFDANAINTFRLGIVNIHFGFLPGYRGRHPVAWAMLNNDFRIGVTIHQIDERIDAGQYLHGYSVARSVDDTLHDINRKIIQRLGGEFPKAIEKLERGGLCPDVQDSPYLANLAGSFQELDPAEHQASYLLNAFRSQYCYGGIAVAGHQYAWCSVKHAYGDWDGWDTFRSADGVDLVFRRV